MTSFQQLEANRRNALRSTGPKTDDGKRRSRVNAVRHGLTAETVVGSLEDAEDYNKNSSSSRCGVSAIPSIGWNACAMTGRKPVIGCVRGRRLRFAPRTNFRSRSGSPTIWPALPTGCCPPRQPNRRMLARCFPKSSASRASGAPAIRCVSTLVVLAAVCGGNRGWPKYPGCSGRGRPIARSRRP